MTPTRLAVRGMLAALPAIATQAPTSFSDLDWKLACDGSGSRRAAGRTRSGSHRQAEPTH
jgi:hypothetical protein